MCYGREYCKGCVCLDECLARKYFCNDFTDLDDCAVGSYEQSCNDYALYGDPARDAADYEFNAQYDRYDGWDCSDPNDDPGCPVCGYRGDCADCVKAKEDYERAGREAFNARVDCDGSDVPF